MGEQRYLRVALGAAALACMLNYVVTREQGNLFAGALFVLVIYSTAQQRRGAFIGALAVGVAVLGVRIFQYTVGLETLTPMWVANVVLPVAVIILSAITISRMRSGKP